MRQILQLHDKHPGLLELALDLLHDLVRRRHDHGPSHGVGLGTVIRRMRVLDEEDGVPAAERCGAGGADAEVALHADDDDGGLLVNELAEARARERVVLRLVDHGLARVRRERELPPRRARLVGVSGVAAVSDVDDERRERRRARHAEGALDVPCDEGAVGHADGRWGEAADLALDEEKDFAGRGGGRGGGGGRVGRVCHLFLRLCVGGEGRERDGRIGRRLG